MEGIIDKQSCLRIQKKIKKDKKKEKIKIDFEKIMAQDE